ncbi:MAG: CorA family divalent cation transporter [Alphaproteobacteria bacterium]|nr:CorA family divalent cation transporter [Alphaproteobacteria bacterium]
MIIFTRTGQHIARHTSDDPLAIPENTVWIDLLEPTRAQEAAVEDFLRMNIPTHEEMSEIEVSNRLYTDDGTTYMTATMMTKVDTWTPETHAVSFILTEHVLVTIRYTDATSFRTFIANAPRLPEGEHDEMTLFLGLIESIVNRMADILERLDRDIDRIIRDIFRNPDHPEKKSVNYQLMLDRIGRCGNLSSKVHHSLVTFGRIMAYISHHKKASKPENQERIEAIHKDVLGLSDHGTYLTGRVNFLLDATLGMINIQQNSVFRVLSTAALIFMPPTLVAGIYGMNFKLIPELSWHWGYPIALLLMLVAAVLPLAYLKQRRVL